MSGAGKDGRDAGTGRFRKGASGNPRGRPKKPPTVSAAIMGALSEKVPINENGRRRRVSKLEATAKQVANKGASGDPRASKLVLELAQKVEDRSARAATPQDLSAADEEIAARVLARFRLIIKEEEANGPHDL